MACCEGCYLILVLERHDEGIKKLLLLDDVNFRPLDYDMQLVEFRIFWGLVAGVSCIPTVFLR